MKAVQQGEEACGNVREAFGEIMLREVGKVVEGPLPGDARVGETGGYAGALGAVWRGWRGSLPVPTLAFAFMAK